MDGNLDSTMRKTASCCVTSCEAPDGPSRSFHSFPSEDAIRRQWQEVLFIEKVDDAMKVCSTHFTEEDFFPSCAFKARKSNVRRLKRTAVPSLFLPPSSLDVDDIDIKDERLCSPDRGKPESQPVDFEPPPKAIKLESEPTEAPYAIETFCCTTCGLVTNSESHFLDHLASHVKKEEPAFPPNEKDVRATWKNLRQEFGKQWRKCNRSGDAAPDEEVVSGWPFFAAMDFLSDQFKPREMTGNMQSHQEDTHNPIHDEDGVLRSLLTSFPNTQDPEQCPPPSPGTPESSPWSRPQSRQSHSNSASGFRQRKTQQSVIGEALLSIEKAKLELRRSRLTEPEDDNMLFLKSLAPQMRKLDPQQNMLYRTEMQRRLYELLYHSHQSP